MKWSDFSSAPPRGSLLCPEADVQQTLCLSIESGRGAFPVLLLRRAGGIRAYVNACPHQFLPLNYRSDRLLSADGARLICSAHGATFDAESGAVEMGADCGLTAIPVVVTDGEVRIA